MINNQLEAYRVHRLATQLLENTGWKLEKLGELYATCVLVRMFLKSELGLELEDETSIEARLRTACHRLQREDKARTN